MNDATIAMLIVVGFAIGGIALSAWLSARRIEKMYREHSAEITRIYSDSTKRIADIYKSQQK